MDRVKKSSKPRSQDKVPTNDQQHIIDALSVQDYAYVWFQLRGVGYNIVPDISERYIVFCNIVKEFENKKSDNFIYFYKEHLKYYKADKNETYYLPNSRNVINTLKNEYISPTEDCNNSKIAKALKNWSNL